MLFKLNEAIRNSLEKIIDMVRETLDRTPPELLMIYKIMVWLFLEEGPV